MSAVPRYEDLYHSSGSFGGMFLSSWPNVAFTLFEVMKYGIQIHARNTEYRTGLRNDSPPCVNTSTESPTLAKISNMYICGAFRCFWKNSTATIKPKPMRMKFFAIPQCTALTYSGATCAKALLSLNICTAALIGEIIRPIAGSNSQPAIPLFGLRLVVHMPNATANAIISRGMIWTCGNCLGTPISCGSGVGSGTPISSVCGCGSGTPISCGSGRGCESSSPVAVTGEADISGVASGDTSACPSDTETIDICRTMIPIVILFHLLIMHVIS